MEWRIHRTSEDSHQPHPIAQVQLDASGDPAAQVGPSGLSGSAGWSGADQGFSGHLDQILSLHQREQAPGGGGGNGIGERQVLQHDGIRGLSATAMSRILGDRESLLAALTAHWADRQLQIPPVLKPVVQPIRRRLLPVR
jgi:hypothetical protein